METFPTSVLKEVTPLSNCYYNQDLYPGMLHPDSRPGFTAQEPGTLLLNSTVTGAVGLVSELR